MEFDLERAVALMHAEDASRQKELRIQTERRHSADRVREHNLSASVVVSRAFETHEETKNRLGVITETTIPLLEATHDDFERIVAKLKLHHNVTYSTEKQPAERGVFRTLRSVIVERIDYEGSSPTHAYISIYGINGDKEKFIDGSATEPTRQLEDLQTFTAQLNFIVESSGNKSLLDEMIAQP